MLAAGTRLGSYEVLAPLGAGGMGEVYRARDLRLGREVALKLLPEALAATPDRLARFEREARTVAALNHPNIVVLYSIEEAGGTRFLTMELVEGRTLGNLVAPGGMPLPELLDLAIPLADALVAAHERGVVHRDLKPANVMVTRDGRVKVLDFGLAKLTQIEPDPALSRVATVARPISEVGRVLGTLPYMAPEQIRGEGADARSDLFSYGVLVYELATGRRPFAGGTYADVSSSILRDDPPPLTRLRADLPADLGRILERCLAKSPRERFQTALDVANELRCLRRTAQAASAAGAARTRPAALAARHARDAAARRAAPGTGAARHAAPQGVASIAVLPFVNRSGSPDDEYFSDGLTDELLNVLAKIRGLRVSARTSAFQFKGAKEGVAAIGHKLGVATLLEGSVRKSGNRVRIAVQLVKVDDGYQLWSESYDRTLDDIFAVQDDIAQSVVKELRAKLLGQEDDSEASGEARAEVARAAQGRATDPEAYQLYLLARHLQERFNDHDNASAITHLEQALGLEPDSARAWAELAHALARRAAAGWGSMEELSRRARQAAERALALEPDLAEGHAVLGYIRMVFDFDWSGSGLELCRALEAAPGNSLALRWAGNLAQAQGRLDDAADLYRRAIEHDPLSAPLHYNFGAILFNAGRTEEAERETRRAIELAPEAGNFHSSLAFHLAAVGRTDEALAEANAETLEWARLQARAVVHHLRGQRAESDRATEELIRKHGHDSAFQVAEVHAARGEADQAFEWLERAYAARDPGLSELRTGNLLDPLREDPRWRLFLSKMGLGGEP